MTIKDDREVAPSRSDAPGWVVALVAVIALFGAGALFVTGVRGKEDCSSIIGSVETDSGMYSPCDLVGYLEVSVIVSLIALAIMTVAKDWRVRLACAVMAALAVLGIAVSGFSNLIV